MKKIAIIITIFIFDRITKMYFINLLESGVDVDFYIFSFLNFIFIQNTGLGFGLFQLEPNSSTYHFITIITAIINCIIFLMVFEKINSSNIPKKILNFLSVPDNWRKDSYTYIFALILGGALGNLFDRAIYYAVPDFIDLHIGNFHWPVFNISDIFITLGIIILILSELFKKKKNSKNV